MDWIFLSLQNSYIETITANVMKQGGEGFERQWGHKSRALMNGVSALLIDSRKFPHPSAMWDYSKKMALNLSAPWSKTSQPPELQGRKVCCLSPPGHRIFVTVAKTERQRLVAEVGSRGTKFFWIDSGVSVVKSLIWLDLKILMTLFLVVKRALTVYDINYCRGMHQKVLVNPSWEARN